MVTKMPGFIAVLMAAALMTSCSLTPGTENSAPVTAPVSPAPVPVVPAPAEAKEVSAAQYLAPFTGMPAAEKNENRPFLVMVNNHPSARPQSGLSYADVLYESLAEGEVTRIAALYQSATVDFAVGPVRSIRPYYIDLGKIYDAVLVHAGGSPDAYTQLEVQKLDHLDEITNAGRFFWREKFRKAPHNLYTGLSKVRLGTENLGLRGEYTADQAMPAFLPGDTDKPGEPSSGVLVTFLLKSYAVSYTYDAELKQYKRFVNDAPHLDLSNNEQLMASNVVVLGAGHIILDNEGRRDIKMVGSGKGYLFQRNKAQAVEWKRNAVNDRFRLYQNGQELGLYPGKTHYLIVPDKPSFEEHLTIQNELQ
ncbi:MAG: yerB [Paenibacillus sp.]|nr:yerB [Paenibacillus sp.]